MTAFWTLSVSHGTEPTVAPVDEAIKPNIILVMADDMGWTDLGSFGSEIDTPNFDQLAQAGVTFTDFHVSVACSPTRSMLLTGNDNHIAGLGNMGELLTDNQKGQPGYEGHLNDRVVTLAEALRASGYHTYMAGKWHLGHTEGRYPTDQGFDEWYGVPNSTDESVYSSLSGFAESGVAAGATFDVVSAALAPDGGRHLLGNADRYAIRPAAS